MVMQNTHDRAARELMMILDSLDSHDTDFTVPMLRAVLVRCHDYLNGSLKLSTLIWHLQRFRNESMVNDARESGDTQ
jgi:hypothetical protein